MIASEDESISLCIEVAPPEVKAPTLRDTEIKTSADHQRLSIYFTIHNTYIRNLIERKQKASVPATIRSKFGLNCIIFKQFNADPKEAKRFFGQEGEIKGNICMILNPHLNVEFRIWFSGNVKSSQDFIWMFFSFSNNGTWKTKSHQLNEDDRGSTFTCKIPLEEFKNYTEPNLLLTIAVKKKQNSNTPQLGIVNMGNTCYMNSCLQMLFYLRPLRKIILDNRSSNKLMKELREVFIMLMEKDENKPIDAQNFLESYEKYNEVPRRQQDVQEFLLDFINEIEIQCPQVKSLWEGKCSETTISIEQGKHYKSVQNEEFAQLDVHLFDTKENPFDRIQDSLQEIMKQEQVEDMIDHDEYGKIKVAKHRTFLTLPDVLFVNLKRYEWNRDKMRLSKIFSPIQYGENLNLGFIIGTPGNDQINPECDYTLFSVIVHKGTSPHNGHYFVFTNVSSNCEKPQWICFNDSVVTKSSPQEVLEFTGKKTKETILQKSIGRFIQKQIESDASSYLLVYIRKPVFNDYQSIKTSIPKDYINEKIKKNALKDKQSIEDVKVLMLDEFQNIDIFDSSLDLMSIPMVRTQTMITQIRKISKQISSGEAKHFYRIYAGNKVVKRIEHYETVQDVISTRRGYTPMSYVLVLTQKLKLLGETLNITNYNLQKIRDKSILHVSRNDLLDLYLPEYSLASPKDLDELEQAVNEKKGRLICVNSRTDFQKYWNRFLHIEIYKNDLEE